MPRNKKKMIINGEFNHDVDMIKEDIQDIVVDNFIDSEPQDIVSDIQDIVSETDTNIFKEENIEALKPEKAEKECMCYFSHNHLGKNVYKFNDGDKELMLSFKHLDAKRIKILYNGDLPVGANITQIETVL